jgi:hypothetical protein
MSKSLLYTGSDAAHSQYRGVMQGNGGTKGLQSTTFNIGTRRLRRIIIFDFDVKLK